MFKYYHSDANSYVWKGRQHYWPPVTVSGTTCIRKIEVTITIVDAAGAQKPLILSKCHSEAAPQLVSLYWHFKAVEETCKRGALLRQKTNWIAEVVVMLNDSLTTQSSLPVPAGSRATICNTCWISMWLFNGGTCGGLRFYQVTWNLPWDTFCWGKHLVYGQAVKNMTWHSLQELRNNSRQVKESHWLLLTLVMLDRTLMESVRNVPVQIRNVSPWYYTHTTSSHQKCF